MDIDAIFEFICEDPIMALIVGGILFLLLGALLSSVAVMASQILLAWGPLLLFLGVIGLIIAYRCMRTLSIAPRMLLTSSRNSKIRPFTNRIY